MVQIIPRVIFTLPSTISAMHKIICLIIFSARFVFISPSAPMDTSLTPLLAMKSRALLTLAILWNLESYKTIIIIFLSEVELCIPSLLRLVTPSPHRDEDGWPALVPGCRSGSGQSWHHPSSQLGTQL